MLSFKWRHFEKEIILLNVRWYLAYPLSYRNLEEITEERGYHVDHSTLKRWVITYAPKLEKEFHKKKRPVCGRWRMDETYIKVKGEWKYFYRAVDKEGNTIDFLLTAKRDMKAAKRFFKKAIKRNGLPELVNIDKSGSNKAALKSIHKEDSEAPKVDPIVIRQCKYLNNIIEQDHRNIKRITRPMLGFKNFYSAQKTLAGIEIMKMIKKGQMFGGDGLSPAGQFYSLAA
ncbi:IS6 family transposase [Bathymodiolus platifrons methanotrophic gill symbiont]|uniref:IS6 family transposase n=1 Tax=Bathymodiolus platifrons methanotrophic gill symbiont TaxID=113268 RepID=UPI001C8D9365|nr:IS6 family transposase [Bathymodiolus platifrons methanotrophic gill symbiont]